MSRYLHDLKITDVCEPQKEGCCLVCTKPLTGKQTKYCSKDCSYDAFEQMMFAKGSSKHIRERVFARDGGICAECGIDCKIIQRISDHTRTSLYFHGLDVNPFEPEMEFINGKFIDRYDDFNKQYMKDCRKIWKDTPLNFGGSCWQADHIVEVINGGKHEMDNLQTLCNLCHKTKDRTDEKTCDFWHD